MSNSSLNWTLLYLDEWTGWLVQVALRVGGQGPGEEGRAQVYRYAGEPEENERENHCHPEWSGINRISTRIEDIQILCK